MAGIAVKLARDREAAEGLGSHERAIKYLNQDYAALRDECLEAGALFQDPSFPALPSSLGFKELGPYSSKTRGIEWKRPTVGSGPAAGCGAGGARRPEAQRPGLAAAENQAQRAGSPGSAQSRAPQPGAPSPRCPAGDSAGAGRGKLRGRPCPLCHPRRPQDGPKCTLPVNPTSSPAKKNSQKLG